MGCWKKATSRAIGSFWALRAYSPPLGCASHLTRHCFTFLLPLPLGEGWGEGFCGRVFTLSGGSTNAVEVGLLRLETFKSRNQYNPLA